jgi:thioester reductase-like protein
MDSQSLTQRLAQLSPEEKQRLLAHLLREKAKKASAAEDTAWIADAQLDKSIRSPGAAPPCSAPGTVFLTGGTGFLGAHLLHELCERTKAIIYCLVRAKNESDALTRLQANFSIYFAHPLDSNRVRPVVGDLAQPNLGLAPETYASLSQEADIIFHNGAHLHHMAPYAPLKASNVDSTVSILRLATTGKPKWVHYVSTLVAAVDRDSDGSLVEELPAANPAELAGGYAQSKWVSEKLLAEASKRGVGVTIFRPGFITGRSDNGSWPLENDHLLRVIKGCVQMGYTSESNLTPNMAPVDFISAAIVGIGLNVETTGRVFNLSNPHLVTWKTLLSWLHDCGYPVRVVSNDVWREQHLRHIDKENALYPVLPLYLGGETTEQHVKLVTKLAKVRNDNTTQMLARLKVPFPTIDQGLWQRYVRFFQHSGFFPAPA